MAATTKRHQYNQNENTSCGLLSYRSWRGNTGTYSSEWSQKGLNFVSDFFGLLKVLRLWKASIWRVVWGEILAWFTVYFLISAMYRLVMNEHQRIDFLGWCNYCDSFSSYISTPLSIAIGFFMSTVYGRWWDHWNTAIGWAEPLAYELAALLPGSSDIEHIRRCTILRWVQASHGLTFVDYAGCYNNEVTCVEDLTDRGLLTKEEVALVKQHGSKAPYDLPLTWSFHLLSRIEEEASHKPNLSPSFGFQIMKVRERIQQNRSCDAILRGFDYIPIPIAQLQTIGFAVYGYFFVNLFGRQFVMAKDKDIPSVAGYSIASTDDYGFPFTSFIELVFYFGWLKCISNLFDPFADAGYAYNLLEIEEGVFGRAHTVFEALRRQHVPSLETDADAIFGYKIDKAETTLKVNNPLGDEQASGGRKGSMGMDPVRNTASVVV